MINLDQYLNKKTFEIFTIEGKEYKADYSASTLLKATKINHDELSETDSTLKVFDVVFGEENAKEILEKLTVEGLSFLVQEIIKNINPSGRQ